MHKFVIPQMSFVRIGRDVLSLVDKIAFIPNAVLVEPGLPDFTEKILAEPVRKSAFDTLGAALNRLVWSGGQ